MKTYQLPFDWCRCTSEQCPRHKQCARFTSEYGPRQPITALFSDNKNIPHCCNEDQQPNFIDNQLK